MYLKPHSGRNVDLLVAGEAGVREECGLQPHPFDLVSSQFLFEFKYRRADDPRAHKGAIRGTILSASMLSEEIHLGIPRTRLPLGYTQELSWDPKNQWNIVYDTDLNLTFLGSLTVYI